MRGLVLLVVTACGASAPPSPPGPPGLPRPSGPAPLEVVRPSPRPRSDRTPIDPILALAPTRGELMSLLQPRGLQLELDATPIDGPEGAAPIAVKIVAERGSRVRVTVRLPHARFVAWTERAALYEMLIEDVRLAVGPGRPAVGSEPQVTLRAGTAVERLARHGTWTHVRYSGAVEVEGWVPDSVLAEEAPSRPLHGRIGSGRKILTLMLGAVIRAEPKWAGRQLAVMANAYFVDTLREIDAAWSEISYVDGDVALTGFVSRRDPLGRIHRRRADPTLAPLPITPNTRVASGTCLYARPTGDPIGYVVGDQEVALASDGRGWWTLAINTPWGPIAFAARGADSAALAACAPDKTVPASTIVAPPTGP